MGNGKIIQPDFNRSVVITPENIGAVQAGVSSEVVVVRCFVFVHLFVTFRKYIL